MTFKATAIRDENGTPFLVSGFPCLAEKTVAFDGATANDPGDKDGTQASHKIFQIKGAVRCKVFAFVTEDLVPAAAGGTIEVGITGDTAALIAQTLQADLDAGEFWKDATPAKLTDPIPAAAKVLAAGQDIYQKVATQDCNDGTVKYICLYEPLTSDGQVLST